jgi:hypothetical protein
MNKQLDEFIAPTPALGYRSALLRRNPEQFQPQRRRGAEKKQPGFGTDVGSSVRSAILILAISLFAVGCQTVPAHPRQPVDSGVALPTGRLPTDEEAVDSDPCAIRLGQIVECIMQYYLLNKQMPLTLDDLKPLADPGSTLQLVCTASGLPYQYYPSGLMSAGRSKRIIVYDPTPAHHGSRWCIMMPYTAPGAPMSLFVTLVPEADFKTYVPGIQ